MKSFIVYLLSVGFAFYGGMKYKQLKRIDSIKVGKLIVEFQDKRECPKIEMPTVEPVEPVEYDIAPELPKTDIETVLEPEKVEESEPISFRKDAYEELLAIEKCYTDIKKTDDIKQWAHEVLYCKRKELYYQNCFNIDHVKQANICFDEQEIEAKQYENDLIQEEVKQYENDVFNETKEETIIY